MGRTLVESTLPVEVVRDASNVLSVSLEDEDTGLAVTPSSTGTLSVLLAGTELEAPAVSLGDPSTATLAAASTTDKALGAQVLLKWTLDGVEYIQSGTLVRWRYRPTVTDAELIRDFPNLLSVGGLSDGTAFRRKAAEKIQRKLWKQGRRPELILDPWALTDAHVHLAKALIGDYYATAIGDERWADFRDLQMAAFLSEWDGLSFKYDSDQDGVIDDSELETVSADSSLWLN